jgi:hypothetical protein
MSMRERTRSGCNSSWTKSHVPSARMARALRKRTQAATRHVVAGSADSNLEVPGRWLPAQPRNRNADRGRRLSRFDHIETGYMRGPKPMTFMYELQPATSAGVVWVSLALVEFVGASERSRPRPWSGLGWLWRMVRGAAVIGAPI